VRGLRPACAETVFWEEVDREVAQAVRACGDVLATLGAHVSSIPFPEAAEATEATGSDMISAVEAYREHQARLGDRLEAYDPVVTFRLAIGRDATANDSLRTLQTCEALRERCGRCGMWMPSWPPPRWSNPATTSLIFRAFGEAELDRPTSTLS